MNIQSLYHIYQQFPNVQTDTRKLQKDDIYFALKGDNFDGNQFAKAALDAGAAYAVIDDPGFVSGDKTILVADVLTTLQELAHYHRLQLQIPFLAITGSNGKTTTKELIHAVLSSSFTTYTTAGNLNNHIGVPLTILKIKNDAQIAVIEMGANHLQEIASYCVVAEPTHGLITNCGKAHLEGFGSLEGVRKGKGELFDFLRTRQDSTAFVMWDYDYLRTMVAGITQVVTYGTSDADTVGNTVPQEQFLTVSLADGTLIPTQLIGDYNLPNVLAAVAVGKHFNIDIKTIATAIAAYTPTNSRSQLISSGTNHIILDAYNANPSSMQLAIDNFSKIAAPKKILMLGAMAEMGSESEKEHNTLIGQIKKHSWHQVVLVGKAFEPYQQEFLVFADVAAAAAWYREQAFENSYFLIKGSRSSKMEQIIQ